MPTSEAFDVELGRDSDHRPYMSIKLAGVEVYRSYTAPGLSLPGYQTTQAALGEFAHWLAKAVRDAEYGVDQ